LSLLGTVWALALPPKPTELLGQFTLQTTSGAAMIRNDAMVGPDGEHRPYITEKVSGWANAASLSPDGGRLMFQVTYPPDNQVRYVNLDFSGPTTDNTTPYPTGRLSCQTMNGEPFEGPFAPAFLSYPYVARTTFIRIVSSFEWFEKNGTWGIDRANYRMLNLAAMPDKATRYAMALIDFDVADMNDLWLGVNSKGLNQAAQDVSYIKVVRDGQTWTVTPIPPSEAGFPDDSLPNVAHLSVPATAPKNRIYTTRAGFCDLGNFVMPFELKLTCDASRSTCQ
jgi:hypothetical protein